MRRSVAAIAGPATLLALIAAAMAAETSPPKSAPQSNASSPPKPADAAPPAAEQPPPYEPQLLRLAELMGALAYLRDLCGSGDGDQFRARMKALLDAEGSTESRRGLLAGAYNQGFRDYQTNYRECTPAAGAIVSRYLTESAKLAAEITARYGG